ncbi:MAG TPA: sigma-54 dependent transcriptional regulator, partial [Polyangiaceae bacterium]|nr:sigma-54 dependent transcriptional regulator [Polyangiaceae bacterium]
PAPRPIRTVGPAVAAVVAVLPLPDALGRGLVPRLRELTAGAPLIVVGADESLPSATEAFDAGAYEHLAAPLDDPAQLLATLGVALGSRRGDRHLRYLHEKAAPGPGWQTVVGASAAIGRVVTVLRQVCSRTSNGATPTILLNGETGTGKGFLAKCVHYNSARRNRNFVEVNCAALPPSLMESELFGHERGSFTDAKFGRPGLFEAADGGTLFLDEIAAVPLDLQAKLLTAIEEKKVRRIGGRAPVRVDVQIIAATHEDLAAGARDGTFRTDLYHRLNVVSVTMPPLRGRGDDVLLLARSFIDELCRDYGMPRRELSPEARAWVLEYPWPGNVRELRNQLERIILLENDEIIRAEHFVPAAWLSASVEISRTQGGLRVSLPERGVPLDLLEREVIREALQRCEGNVSRAARYLSISRQTMIYRLKKHGLS